MISIRQSLYAGLLALSSLNVAPVLASAQESHGAFTLPHDVRWQNMTVPAGDYRFSFESDGSTGLLTLSKMSGARTGFVMLVTDTDVTRPTDLNQLIVERTSEVSYVSAMMLPEYGVTLHFAPPKATGKQLATGVTAPLAPGQ